MMNNELFTMTDGVKTDAELHDDILDNKDADVKLSCAAIERAIARGMSRAEARKLYGIKKRQEVVGFVHVTCTELDPMICWRLPRVHYLGWTQGCSGPQ